MARVIEAEGLGKRFGQLQAVRGIDFAVERGESFGFLGPNGAGKTSTMRMIACVSPPTSGRLRVLGQDPQRDGPRIRASLGIVSQADMLDLELSVLENLVLYGRYFGLPYRESRARALELLTFVQLEDRAGDRVEPLSGGMKRRLVIARGLMNNPEILLLDEPTTGLDPQARHLVWDRLYRLKQQGVTLILTTHYMDEAEQLCDRLAIMDRGRIVAGGTPAQLIQEHVGREVVELRPPEAASHLDGIGERVERLPDRVLIYAEDGDATLALIHRRGIRTESSLVRRGSLEDVFLRLTGHTLVE